MRPWQTARFVVSAILVTILVTILAEGAERSAAEPAKRARHPKFDPSAAAEVFFDDVFSTVSGDRPATTPPAPKAPATDSPGGPESEERPDTGSGWSAVVSATTIEDEVKALKTQIDKNVKTPTDFAARGHKEVRRDFALLAALFAIIHEYDGTVRWKAEAAVARDRLARAAANAKAGGNANVFKEAKDRKSDLDDLIGGAPLGDKAAESPTDWGRIGERALLMQRLEAACEDRLSAWTANERDFASHGDETVHEAEMVALIATVLTREGLEDAGDAEYAAFARDMKQAASDIARAARDNDYPRARTSAGQVAKSCSACHESYR